MDMTKAILFQQHLDAGMTLDEYEDTVALYDKRGGIIARWYSSRVTIDEIRRAADLALGITFGKETSNASCNHIP